MNGGEVIGITDDEISVAGCSTPNNSQKVLKSSTLVLTVAVIQSNCFSSVRIKINI